MNAYDPHQFYLRKELVFYSIHLISKVYYFINAQLSYYSIVKKGTRIVLFEFDFGT